MIQTKAKGEQVMGSSNQHRLLVVRGSLGRGHVLKGHFCLMSELWTLWWALERNFRWPLQLPLPDRNPQGLHWVVEPELTWVPPTLSLHLVNGCIYCSLSTLDLVWWFHGRSACHQAWWAEWDSSGPTYGRTILPQIVFWGPTHVVIWLHVYKHIS